MSQLANWSAPPEETRLLDLQTMRAELQAISDELFAFCLNSMRQGRLTIEGAQRVYDAAHEAMCAEVGDRGV